jgi:mannose-6-phosphate isomerase-like protein (cupin superfamily)
VAEAQVLRQGEGRSAAAVGVSIVFKAGGDDTDGRWSFFEYTAPPQFAGPPPHWHKETDETFLVLEGTVRFEVDGEPVDAHAGDYVRVPPGVVHKFSNATDEPARFLGLTFPSGLDKYLEELAEMMAGESKWPPDDMRPGLALMAKYDTFPPLAT